MAQEYIGSIGSGSQLQLVGPGGKKIPPGHAAYSINIRRTDRTAIYLGQKPGKRLGKSGQI